VTGTVTHTAALIALDWGTTQARAALLDAQGGVLATRAAPVGVMAVRDGHFAEALAELIGDLLPHSDGARLPLIASGMIGSRQGWREAPYLPCPASIEQAAEQLIRVPTSRGVDLAIVPGLICEGGNGQADVMRGEETQLWGAGLPAGSLCILPGTHSKWAWIGEGERIERFATYMTGELYAVLTRHSILGRLMQLGADEDAAAFAQGVRLGLAEHANATHALFAARTAGLTGRLGGAALADFLSGMLIGIEIGSATRERRPERVTLLGEPALCARYEAALGIAGLSSGRASSNATTRGLWRIACAAGMM
jgi:2-dehydro-3-deoxygalactonokinase